jgi:biopolymer transport protein ExbB/TolQ
MISQISAAFAEGGIWMIAILAVHIVSLALIAERVYALYFQRTVNQRSLVQNFERDIKGGKLDKVSERALGLSKSHPAAAIVLAGAQAAHSMGGREEIQAKMDEVLAIESEKLERRTGFLAMLANVGTLLGLLGTVIGLIQAFNSVANMNPVEKSIYLTRGVSLAMNTTAYGLIMAIPTLIMYAVLTNRTAKLQEDLNQATTKAMNWLSYNFENVGSKRSSRSV